MNVPQFNQISIFRKIFCLIILVFWLTAAPLNAEILPIKTYTTADGLIYEGVYRTFQDSQGFIWFLTPVGISRFDGYGFTSFGLEDGLFNPAINDFVEAEDGIYWLSSASGSIYGAALYRFDTNQRKGEGKIFTPFRVSEERSSANDVNRLFKTSKGEIYLGTGAGAFRLEAANGKAQFHKIELTAAKEARVLSFAEDADASLWIGTERGLFRRLENGKTVVYEIEPDGEKDLVRSLAVDRQNRLWIVTNSRGLSVFNPEPAASIGESDGEPRKLEFAATYSAGDLPQGSAFAFTLVPELKKAELTSVFCRTDGRVLLGSRAGGLIEFDGRDFRAFTRENGLSDNAVADAREDRFGNMWLASSWGAMKVSPAGFSTFKTADGLAEERIFDVFADHGGNIYAVNKDWQINRFDGRKFVSITPNLPPEARENWNTHRVAIDGAGEWWIGTPKGLFRFGAVEKFEQLAEDRFSEHYTAGKSGLLDDNIGAIFADSQDNVWFGYASEQFNGHLSRWERGSGKFYHYSPAEGIAPDCHPFQFNEAADKTIYAICRTDGYVVFRSGRFSSRIVPEFKQAGLLHDALIDRSGGLWIATALGGLFHFENPAAENHKPKNYKARDGLSSSHIQYLAEDAGGNIYLVTSGGMERLSPVSGEIKHFTIADGLAAAGTGAAARDRAGNLWFGTSRGVSRFVPENEAKASVPQVFIQNLRIAGKDVPLAALGETEISGLTLQPDERQIEIDYYALALASGANLRYQTKIENLDQDWSEPTAQRNVKLNLSAGNYRFLVRAVNPDGAASERPAMVSFTVRPPFWRTWEFLVAVVFLTGAAIFALDRYRVAKTRQVENALSEVQKSKAERLRELKQVRTRIATDLHDDIGSSLSQIAVLSEVARSQTNGDGRQSEPLAQISTVSNELVEAMSDIVWAINPTKDNLHDLVQRMRRFASDVFTAKRIEFRFLAPDVETALPIGANLRREIFVIFKEAINNVAKHSEAIRAKIEFQINEESLKLSIEDDGRGFDAARINKPDFVPATRGGNGVTNIKRRAGELGGTCEIVSAPGDGTKIYVEIPLTQTGSANDAADSLNS